MTSAMCRYLLRSSNAAASPVCVCVCSGVLMLVTVPGVYMSIKVIIAVTNNKGKMGSSGDHREVSNCAFLIPRSMHPPIDV